ncbi:thioredoxin family protein [Hyperthermus butylicus]|uniref:Thioredoxin n=1 Tax=Hyperthermus butylicus (strain DSM 5456 / JCM 9403 / PLM1-5) TaxID=415426 RepID=A2BLV1_HYPBU|nr:thioredoxin family protein [Hyperthermus butylicus]ABM80962.1 putative Thioredoxin [Hyperthermus butylicus DSM 5456]
MSNDIVRELRSLIEKKVNELDKELGDPLIYLNKDNFDEVLKNYKVVVVEFSAPWCNPCKAYTPVFKRVARRLADPEKGIVFAYLDTDEAPDIADRYSVDNIPTTIIFVNGHVADVILGVTQESKLTERVQNIVKELLRGEK